MELVTAILVLLSTDNLAGLHDVAIVDARAAEAYAAGHIPGALHLDPATLSEERSGVVGLLKPVAELSPVLSALGLDPAKQVVVYSAMATPEDLSTAARLFWILEYVGFEHVAVLDGGFAKWSAEGRPIEQGAAAAPAAARMEPMLRPRPELMATHDEVVEAERTGVPLVDFRSPEEYAGLSKKDVVKRAGHIPGAGNVPATDLVDKHEMAGAVFYTLKPIEALQELLAGDAAKPVIAYCNTGRSASAGYLAYRILGRTNVSLYDGSMAEWSCHSALGVTAGPQGK